MWKFREEDIIEKFILGTGSGGQKINKTASCVYLKHVPTGIEVKCQATRSREQNRYFARQELSRRLQELQEKEKRKREAQAASLRREKRKRTKTQKLKLVETKRHLSTKKRLRKHPKNED